MFLLKFLGETDHCESGSEYWIKQNALESDIGGGCDHRQFM